MNEGDSDRKTLSGESKDADESLRESEDKQEILFVILAEAKRRRQDRKIHTDCSSGTNNLNCDDAREGMN